MKAAELRKQSVEQLQGTLLELCREQFNLRMQRANSGQNKVHLFKEARRNVARVKTVMTELEGKK